MSNAGLSMALGITQFVYREHKRTSASAHGFKSLKNLKHCVPNFSQFVGHLRPMFKEPAKKD